MPKNKVFGQAEGGLSFPDFSVIIQKDYLYARFTTSISGQSLTKFES